MEEEASHAATRVLERARAAPSRDRSDVVVVAAAAGAGEGGWGEENIRDRTEDAAASRN